MRRAEFAQPALRHSPRVSQDDDSGSGSGARGVKSTDPDKRLLFTAAAILANSTLAGERVGWMSG